jgi:hypothetical protein
MEVHMAKFLNHSPNMVDESKNIINRTKVFSLDKTAKEFEELYKKIEYETQKIDINKFFILETEALSITF